LVGAHLAALRDVGVEAHQGGQRSVESPENIGLGHGMTRGVSGLGEMDGCLRAKIANKTLERIGGFIELVVGIDIAIVVAWNRKDGSRVMHVGLVKLPMIVDHFAVVINDIP